MIKDQDTYLVKKLSTEFSGKAEALPWPEANTLSDFHYPWEDGAAPLLEFRALYDRSWFYFCYNVTDENISVLNKTNAKHEVLYGDRVEIFFSPDRLLSNYYCLEIDYLARVYDYKASFYRKFEPEWSWPPNEITVSAIKTITGYQVFGAVSMKSLEEFGLINNREMLVGLFRGKCSHASPSMDSMRWISWVRPESETPDFHIPSAFGRFLLL